MQPEAQSEQATDNEEERSEIESQEVLEPVSELGQEANMGQKTLVVYTPWQK